MAAFDVFLSHNSQDKPAVRELAAALRQRGLTVWLDEDELQPGLPHQPLLEEAIHASQSVAVLVGPCGIGPWEDMEMQAALSLAVKDKRPIIPVLLTDAPAAPDLPLFLSNRTWVDLRPRLDDKKLDTLEWGITGVKPDRENPGASRTIQLDQLPTVAGGFFGRDDELKLLDRALDCGEPRIVEFVAPGGTGKTKLLRHWLDQRGGDIGALIAWSFYSQGASEDKQVSSSPFFSEAFRLLGSAQTEFPTEEAKGRQLAELLRQHRCLLVLDGLEPMQHAGRGMRGELKDRALLALLKSLLNGATSPCLITTRLRLPELRDRAHAASHDLHNLSEGDGVELLRSLHVHGREDALRQTVRDYGCHALALHLLGNALRVFCDGDIGQRDHLPELLEPEPYANDSPASLHAYKVMQAYQDWLKDGQGRDLPELRLLYLLGLFDHPVEKDMLQKLWREAIADLTVWDESSVIPAGTLESSAMDGKPPFDLSTVRPQGLPSVDAGFRHPCRNDGAETAMPATLTDRQWQTAIAALRDDHHLLTCHDAQSKLLDCHPLIREFFGRRLQRQHPAAWTQAHRWLYDYYKALPKQDQPDTLEDLRPLFHAVAHGCAAGMHQQALDEVYWPRVRRENEAYLVKKLGAFSDDLAVVAHFFAQPWRTPAAGLSEDDQAAALNWAGFRLRALGRLREAVEPMRAGIEASVQQEDWKGAAQDANNLSELQLTLGDIQAAIASAESAVDYADKTDDQFERIVKRTTLADARLQAGDTAAAQMLFEAAERLQRQWQPQYPRLYSLRGFRYCDLLLAQRETAAVLGRAEESLALAKQHLGLLDVALDQLSLGRAYLQQALATRRLDTEAGQDAPIVNGTAPFQPAKHWLDFAVAGLRKAGYQYYLPLGLLAHATYCRHVGDFDAAREDLREVFDLAEPSGMLLHLTDTHLEAARLALASVPKPTDSRGWQEAKAAALSDTDAAARLIEQTGYKRRLPELQALRQALAGLEV